MKGKFYAIGVGPGDSKLITVKAVETLRSCQCIAVPKAMRAEESTALSIAKPYLPENCEILYLPFSMSREKAVLEKIRRQHSQLLAQKLEQGLQVALLTLGDPAVYSTCMYIYQILKQQGFSCEVIPGVTSFSAAAARLGVSLCEDKEVLTVAPCYDDNVCLDKLSAYSDTLVLMKGYQTMDKIMKSQSLPSRIMGVSNCGMPDEEIYWEIKPQENKQYGYFTTFIYKKESER